jgi:hypothetical protein
MTDHLTGLDLGSNQWTCKWETLRTYARSKSKEFLTFHATHETEHEKNEIT